MSENTTTQDKVSLLTRGLGTAKNLFQTKSKITAANSQVLTQTTPSSTKGAQETYHAWGVRWSGNAQANHSALSPALQSCYTQNVGEQNMNQALQQQNQQNITSQIQNKKGLKDGENIKLQNCQREKVRLAEDVKNYQDKIDSIKSNDNSNIMATVNFYIGALITILLAAYLFIFYSSASFSAFFGNNDISTAGQVMFDPHCYSEAVNNGLGQLLFILLMPVIFLGLGFLIHQFGEADKGWSKYIKISCLYIVTFIFDTLLAFEISEKVYDSTVLSPEPYTVSLAFNSPSFWIVYFPALWHT